MRMSSQHVYFEIHECCTVHIPFLINLNVHQQQPNLLAIIDMPTTVFPPKCHAVLHHYQPLTHHYQNDDRRERLDESNQGYKLEISHVVISPIWPQIINPSSSHKQLKTLLSLHCNHTYQQQDSILDLKRIYNAKSTVIFPTQCQSKTT